MNWVETNSYLIGIVNKTRKIPDPIRIAGFDLDDTLIQRFKQKDDYKFKLLDSKINDKMKNLVNNNYLIIIFSNQVGLFINKNINMVMWKKMIENLSKIMMKDIEHYYFAIYVSKMHDLYRKPNLGLWNLMKSDLKNNFSFDAKKIKLRISKKSFFCGDAAGRKQASFLKKRIHPLAKKGDFSDTDYKFALNIKIDFITPDDFYLDNSPPIECIFKGFNPKKYLDSEEYSKNTEYEFKPRSKELIVMVGPSGSGKSEFVKKYILPMKYVHINQDTCKSKTKCISLTKTALTEKKSIVIDNTNPDILSRMSYTTLAKEYGYKHIRCIIMMTNYELAKHLNNVRHLYSRGIIPKINKITYNIYNSKYVPPIKLEYFDKIEKIDFAFDKNYLMDSYWKKLFLQWSEA
uniref:Uncharacterized protein n=1 Tax=viral metagenome TaxID=1070528 RepID=A0A6C0LVD7_9ZZZZ